MWTSCSLIHVNIFFLDYGRRERSFSFCFHHPYPFRSWIDAHFVTSPAFPFKVHISQRMSPVCASKTLSGWKMHVVLIHFSDVHRGFCSSENWGEEPPGWSFTKNCEGRRSEAFCPYTDTEPTLTGVSVYVRVFTQPWRLELPNC